MSNKHKEQLGSTEELPNQDQALYDAIAKGGSEAEKAREALVCNNLGFADALARKYKKVGLNMDDLVQEARLGLVLASKSFNPSLGVRFTTYAAFYCKKCIMEAARQCASLSVPDDYNTWLSKVKKTVSQLEQELHRTPTNEEVAERIGTFCDKTFTKDVVADILNASRIHTSLDETIPTEDDDEGESRGNNTPDTSVPPTDAEASYHQLMDRIKQLLSPKELQIFLAMSNDPNKHKKVTMELAKEFNLCNERIRQIYKGACAKLANDPGIKGFGDDE